ncbi:uncharacterized protein LOC130865126 [Chionomys nivalis]|uniref:uncharacterized protein LOC130865126 n=1 Tax=Chionomys nivalis TaxID=269649 RepID=UPI002595BC66|nr:uncharacterized protein LOC130865126 [Chionomys nivalis]
MGGASRTPPRAPPFATPLLGRTHSCLNVALPVNRNRLSKPGAERERGGSRPALSRPPWHRVGPGPACRISHPLVASIHSGVQLSLRNRGRRGFRPPRDTGDLRCSVAGAWARGLPAGRSTRETQPRAASSSPKLRRNVHSRMESYRADRDLSREDTGCNQWHIRDLENLDGNVNSCLVDLTGACEKCFIIFGEKNQLQASTLRSDVKIASLVC